MVHRRTLLIAKRLEDPLLAPPIRIDIPRLQDARAALETHQARRPEPETPAFTTWCDEKLRLMARLEMAENATRSQWSEPFVVPEKAIPSTPPPQENPMPPATQPPISPEAQLDALLTKISTATSAAVAARDEKHFQRALGQVYQFRHQVNQIVEKHALQAPVLPAIPANPWSAKHKPERKPQRSQKVLPQTEGDRPLPREPSPAQPETPTVSAIAEVRRSIWLLMAELERTPVQARAAMVEELALLDAAAHAAHSLATGRLEVA